MKRSRDGYRDRRRSSRRLAQETQRNVDLRGLGKTLRPAPPTIAPLRTHNRAPLRQVGRPFTRRCKKLDLFGAERVAMDGSTVRAVNANARPFTQGTLNKRIGPIDERVDADLTELERRADQEAHGTGGGGHAATLAATREALKPRNLLEEGFQAQLRARGQAHLSLPAPERHALKRGKGRGPAVCSTVQTAVDAKHKLMVACAVTTAPGDRDWLSPVALQAKGVLACRVDAVADVGSYQGHEVKVGLEAGLTPYGARPITAAHKTRGRFGKEDFGYDRATDPYQCPAGARLTFRCDTVERGRHLRDAAPSACTGGARTQPCPRHHGGRRIPRGVDEQRLEEREPRVRSRREASVDGCPRLRGASSPCGRAGSLYRGRAMGTRGFPGRRAVAGHRMRPSAKGFDTVWRCSRPPTASARASLRLRAAAHRQR